MSKYVEVQRRQTEHLIASDPILFALKRAGQLVSNGVGGVKREGDPSDTPPVPRFLSATTGASRFARTLEGRRVEGDYVLIGVYDDDIRADDEFSAHGADFKVVWVEPDRRYQTKAIVVRVSGGNAT
jgi:hypothetical protein